MRGGFSDATDSAEIVRWVAESMRPFNIVKDRGFDCLMKTGRPEYKLPSPTTVGRDVRKVFARVQQRVAHWLQARENQQVDFESARLTHKQEYDGELNFATDAWTSPNQKAMVAFTVHFEHQGTPMTMVLDVVEVAKSHSGLNLATAFADMIHELKLETKVSPQDQVAVGMQTYQAEQMLAVTCDNASSNDVMIEEMEEMIASFRGGRARSRCFCHIINLVAKMVLRQFEPPKRKKKKGTHQPEDEEGSEPPDELSEWENELREMMDDLDFDEEDETAPGADDLDGFYDVRNDLDAANRATLEVEVRPVKMMLLKVSVACISLDSKAHLSTIRPCPAPEDIRLDPPLDDPPASNVVGGP